MFEISFPPLAMAECGLCGAFGLIPTTYGTEEEEKKIEKKGLGVLGTTKRTRHWVVTEPVVGLAL